MSNEKKETIADIEREMRALGRLDEKSTDKIPRTLQALGLRTYANRIEAAAKRMVESIHRAMVIIAGIEMESSEDPPRLWTALEDAYDALSDALGTDGETTADEEEAKATGRHFVVKSPKNAAAMREALEKVRFYLPYFLQYVSLHREDAAAGGYYERIQEVVTAALAAPPRNCDVGTEEEQNERHKEWCSRNTTGKCSISCYICFSKWAQMPYENGGAK